MRAVTIENMPPREWLKPPRSLLLILFLVTLVSVSALAWFGTKLLYQDRIVETQRAQERLEQSADRIAATLREKLAETGERLHAWVSSGSSAPAASEVAPDGLLLLLTDNDFSAEPDGKLLYYPFPAPLPEARPAYFAEAEALEFQLNQPEGAARQYAQLAESSSPPIRAGSLMRLGRALWKMGRTDESRAAFARLATIRDAKAAGAPAELVGKLAVCELSGHKADAEKLQQELLQKRWRLTRGQFDFYWSAAAQLAGRQGPPPADAVALSDAAARAWTEHKREPAGRGHETAWVDGRPFFFIWRGDSSRRAVLVAKPETLLKQITAGGDATFAMADAEGRILAGRRSGSGRAAVRTAAEAEIPWTLYVTGTRATEDAAFGARQRFLLLVISVMALFLVCGAYFIARAIRRETEVSRMQSDFVSAVSHEFRSPLTSMRQLSEILALGRVPSEERRQVYYDTLVRETSRLQRLVESLLNFGRMEAGARKYKFEEMEVAGLVRRVAAEFEHQPSGAGRRIEMDGPETGCRIEADPEAISVALRNLVDNALKYSPADTPVWVEWSAGNSLASVRVRDQGPGISDAEKKVIFRKFVRGSAAESANVKGSGVGLSMVRHIVDAHGGEITLASKPGQGSTFVMVLPAVVPAPSCLTPNS